MKSWYIEKLGTTKDLKWGDLPMISPKPKQIAVKVHASSINPADLKLLTGKDGAKFIHSSRFPIRLGYDFSGTTDQGEDVFGFLPYSASSSQGAFSEKVFVNPDEIAKKPLHLTHEQSASLGTVGCTALQAIRDVAAIGPGKKVLINGASGGVGIAAVQIAKILGARVVSLASQDKSEFVKSFGSDEVYDYRKTAIDQIQEKFDLVFDVASNSSFSACESVLASGGTYITLLPSPSLLLGFLKSLTTSKKVRMVVVKSKKANLQQLAKWAEAGQFKVVLEQVFNLKDLPQALDLQASGRAKGKISLSH